MCVRAAEGLSDLRSREVNTVSGGSFSWKAFFYLPFLFLQIASFLKIRIISMDAMHCVKNVERHITVWWSEA